MRKFFPFKNLFVILVLTVSDSLIYANKENHQAIATLLNVEGAVKVETVLSPKRRHAREGMLLYPGNKIHTSGKSKTTIEYRDGSRVRLFKNSVLVLNFSKEQSTKKRTFKYQLTLKGGAMRGHFRKGLQRTKIRTPTAIIGIKGTSIRISDKKNRATVSLTEGKIEVSNLSSRVTLNPGQWLTDFDPYSNLGEKVGPIPNLLSIKTDKYELDFNDEKSKQLELNVQIQNSINGKLIKRGGLVVIESDYKRIRLPKRFFLNERGFARVLIGLDPPNKNLSDFNGLVTIRAFMDDDGFDDVAEGHLVLKIKNLGNKRTLIIHPDKGVLKK